MDIEMGECILRILALNICMLGNFVCFFYCQKQLFSKNSCKNIIRVFLNSLEFVGPDLGPNCLQRLSADDKSPLLHIKCIE